MYVRNYIVRVRNKISQNSPDSQTYACRRAPGIRCALCQTSGPRRILLEDGGVLRIIDPVKRSAIRQEIEEECKIENVLKSAFIFLKTGKKQPLLEFSGGTSRSNSRNSQSNSRNTLDNHSTRQSISRNTLDRHSTRQSISRNTSDSGPLSQSHGTLQSYSWNYQSN